MPALRARDSLSGPLFGQRLAMAAVLLLWWGWLASFPWQLTSDDALNLAHAVVRYSVVEESPHFPGYPGFVWLARVLHALGLSPTSSVIALSWLGAGVLAWQAVRWIEGEAGAHPLLRWGALGVLLLHPMTPTLALSGLTDAPAIACLLAAGAAQQRRQWRRGAFWVAVMLAIRPSFAVIAVGLWIYGLWQVEDRRRWLRETALITLALAICCAGFVWYHDGIGYLYEAQRFISGHYELWGNTSVSHPEASLWQWRVQLSQQLTPLGLLLLAPLLWWQRRERQLLLLIGLSVIWLLSSQNPENARHAAPLLYLIIILLGRALNPVVKRLLASPVRTHALGVQLAVVVGVGLLGWISLGGPRQAALPVALQVAQQRCSGLVTQYGVKLARAETTLPVVDGWYAASAGLMRQEGGCRLSSRSLTGSNVMRFPGRFAAEKTFYLKLGDGTSIPR